jgi:hypothetical protein
MIRLISFATDDFTISADRLKATALRNGVDEVTIYTPKDFDYREHLMENIIQELLPNSRGYSWWIWKSAIILKKLFNPSNNPHDIIIYCDAGTEITDNVNQVINAMDEDIFFCSNGWKHTHWCKKETIININGPAYWENLDNKQVQASFIIFKVNDKTRAFVQEWYAWSIMPGMIDNTPRGPQFPEFQEHRHDQAILTCLQIKYGYKLHWFPASMNQHQIEPCSYGTILNHHRKRNNEW